MDSEVNQQHKCCWDHWGCKDEEKAGCRACKRGLGKFCWYALPAFSPKNQGISGIVITVNGIRSIIRVHPQIRAFRRKVEHKYLDSNQSRFDKSERLFCSYCFISVSEGVFIHPLEYLPCRQAGELDSTDLHRLNKKTAGIAAGDTHFSTALG